MDDDPKCMIPECCNPAIYCSLECAQADQPKPKPKVVEQTHVVDFTKVGPDYICVCECGARWSTARSAGPDRLQESIKSHHISVGIKPSEVL